ncbi:50S ribosomal protein L25/general stress protein Ctc [Actinocrinis puniceicyclus]|uniref:Large ribosomal subunit protein bL25 n=1 Tax=Actinocrinis puniceicyclus TaxID=977794 RepID=A0A8J7WH98_9ACTN|nr:50S ribosomal protein L25/general stress protein Ctc [Actinocrinis puniceicyclus]MBS2962173.1 50S ribosomal protein L25/general stress protein Ctc [Actinocrinis puniceicyclus]
MSEVRISAEPRDTFGKGAARQLRRDGKIPAVLYGHKEEPVHLALPEHELFLALKTPNVLLNLDLGDRRQLALPKAVQKDPVRRSIEHVDLLLVRRGEKVTVEIPIVTVGDVVSGGLLEHTLNVLSIEAEATHIPGSVEVSVQGLEIGGQILAKEVTLPRGAELVTDPEHLVVHVLAAPTAEQMAGTGAEAEPEAGAGESETASPEAGEES